MASNAERAAKRKERLKALGLCVDCGGERVPSAGDRGDTTGFYYELCRAKHSKWARERRERRERLVREGKCVKCSGVRGEDGTGTYCKPCWQGSWHVGPLGEDKMGLHDYSPLPRGYATTGWPLLSDAQMEELYSSGFLINQETILFEFTLSNDDAESYCTGCGMPMCILWILGSPCRYCREETSDGV